MSRRYGTYKGYVIYADDRGNWFVARSGEVLFSGATRKECRQYVDNLTKKVQPK